MSNLNYSLDFELSDNNFTKYSSSIIEILDFYKKILNQFGWQLKSEKTNEALVFIRDNEILKININNFNIIQFNSFLSLKNS